MAFTEGGNEGALNGTSEVTLVAAPGASTRRIVRKLTIQQRDTAAVTVTISKKKAATLYQIDAVTLNPGDRWEDSYQVLDATDESIVASMSGAASTTNPDFTATYADAS